MTSSLSGGTQSEIPVKYGPERVKSVNCRLSWTVRDLSFAVLLLTFLELLTSKVHLRDSTAVTIVLPGVCNVVTRVQFLLPSRSLMRQYVWKDAVN